MAKITEFKDGTGEGPEGFMFHCPGCNMGHHVAIEPHRFPNGAGWTWNGSLDAPTFTPSVLTTTKFTVEGKASKICHLFVKDGKLEFLSDCTHALAGQTVEMKDANQPVTCPKCNGFGVDPPFRTFASTDPIVREIVKCTLCEGEGEIEPGY